MKHIFFITIAALITSCSSSIDDLSKHNGEWIWWHPINQEEGKWIAISDTGSWQPEDGYYVEWYQNGQKLCEGNYLNGKMTGIWNDWYDDEQINSILEYENDSLNGTCTWYIHKDSVFKFPINGYLKMVGDRKKGLREGKDVYYYPTGELLFKCDYKNNLKHGTEKQYYKNGQLSSEYNYINGLQHGLSKVWDSDGDTVAVVNYKNDKPHGKGTKWYKNGQIELIQEFKNGLEHGPHFEYYEDGAIKVEANFKNNWQHGKFIFYSNEGLIDSTFNLSEGEIIE